uniref:Oligosaccharyl transferase STT3 N-terminal domain-containing protein n=1 Tax=Archaeoglobus fulgidus TaxID=2234 RepID=A0A7J2TGS2_ARCFL
MATMPCSCFPFIFPVILGVISTILLYQIARKLFGEEVALMSALIFAVCPIVVNYSVVGFADHHIWNLFLVLLSVFLLLTRPVFASVPLTILSLSWLGGPNLRRSFSFGLSFPLQKG